MKKYVQIKKTAENPAAVAALKKNRHTQFFIGWKKGFGYSMILFVFPFNKKEHPSL